jgi:acyl-CoA synthetase (AMP-forming)/AMP-acid ligase II
VLVPLNTRFRGEEARYVLGKVRPRLLVVDDGFLDTGYLAMLRAADPAREAIPEIVVTMAETDDPAALAFPAFLAAGDGVTDAEIDRRIDGLDPQDVSDILFTSGTTGFPKGAMVSHAGNLRVNEAWSDMVGLRAGDRCLLVNPFFHSFGYRAGVLACLIRRATIVPLAVFDAEAALRLVERERITVFPGAPTVYATLLEHPRRSEYDTGSVRLAVTGAAVVPVPLLERMRTELGFTDVITAYGLTESCGTATVCPPDTDQHRLSTSCGTAIAGTEVAIVDAEGRRLPPGERGEIVIRGHNVMVGYFEDPDATAAAVDPDGWLHSGDIGWMDADGFLRVTDRIKDMYVVGGFNVYPAEVERLLARHPAVAEAAVVGVPDERMGEVGHAYVRVRPGAVTTAAELAAFCRAEMANFKVPRSITFVDELPRTASGKVQKFRLRPRPPEESSCPKP